MTITMIFTIFIMIIMISSFHDYDDKFPVQYFPTYLSTKGEDLDWSLTSSRLLQAMDLVIRFNKLQSYTCGEKFDVWASRHGDAVTSRYWGIGEPPPPPPRLHMHCLPSGNHRVLQWTRSKLCPTNAADMCTNG